MAWEIPNHSGECGVECSHCVFFSSQGDSVGHFRKPVNHDEEVLLIVEGDLQFSTDVSMDVLERTSRNVLTNFILLVSLSADLTCCAVVPDPFVDVGNLLVRELLLKSKVLAVICVARSDVALKVFLREFCFRVPINLADSLNTNVRNPFSGFDPF